MSTPPTQSPFRTSVSCGPTADYQPYEGKNACDAFVPPQLDFDTLEAGVAACRQAAPSAGFCLMIRDTKANRKVLMCDRARTYQPHGKRADVHEDKRRKGTSKATQCGFKLEVKRLKGSGRWRATVLEHRHNHDRTPPEMHPLNRRAAWPAPMRDLVRTSCLMGLPTRQVLILAQKAFPEAAITDKDVSNEKMRMKAQQMAEAQQLAGQLGGRVAGEAAETPTSGG